jgi:hypothetical protein
MAHHLCNTLILNKLHKISTDVKFSAINTEPAGLIQIQCDTFSMFIQMLTPILPKQV